MRKVILLIIVLFTLSILSPYIASAGWKENYRNKYSKKSLDPNSEKAKRIRRLLNPDLKIRKWKKPEEPTGEKKHFFIDDFFKPKHVKESEDKFEGYTSNFSPVEKTKEEDIK